MIRITNYGDSLLNTLNSPRRFQYDGDALIGEYDSSNALLRRYVHGGGVDNPLIWYEGAITNVASLRRLRANHQGSIVAVADYYGTVDPANSIDSATVINSYDEWGIPAATNLGRLQYSLPEPCVGHMVK